MFRKLFDAINRFMYGRYGADQLFYALIIIFFVLSVVNRFVASLIILIIQYLVFVFAIFRYLSKNIYKRREENRKFMSIWQSIKNFFAFQRDKFRDRKVCRYRKCKYCRAALRLPIKKGKNSVKCPRCGKSFKVNIWI
ncbi:MAG: hypothetical protein E7598_01750 [Ruminococcaceae bacterium]|nr:hypothetical protein [Oscillospiraceae bacterium]